MSIAQNFPNLKPTLLLDFSNTEALDSRVTFTRASTATYYGTETAKAEENLLVRSQEFETIWTGEGVSRTADTTTAPDGTTTADTITETATTSAHRLDQPVATSGTLTLSVFAKLGAGTRFLTIGVSRDTTHNCSATFDLSLGTNTQTQVNGGVYSSPSATITAVAQSFYRCTFTVTTDTATLVRIGLNDTSTPTSGNRAFGASYTGDNTSSLIFWGAQLEQRSAVTAYTPTTTQPITNYIPQLLTAASGVARFDHNPTTFESLGLEIEESRTNLFTYSEQFDNAAWTKTRSSVTANTIVSPDGTLDAEKLIEDTDTNTHQVVQSVSFTSGTAYTLTAYMKAAERTWGLLRLPLSAFTTTLQAYFNLSTGAVGAISANVTASITPVGNGWYRCSMTATATATTTGFPGIFLADGDNGATYTGNGYSGIYIWGAQLEAGAFATSYIPTVASQVTRAADAASMTGTNFSSWYNAAEGTLYAESRCPNGISGNINRIASLNDGTTSNRIEIDTGSLAATVCRITTNGTSQGQPTAGSYTDFQLRKSALAIQVDNFTLAANTLTASDTSALVPVVDRLMIGQSTASTSFYLNGTMAKLAYYPIRLTNTQLQALTS